jgi:Na+/H+ antiporter NhaC
MYAAEYRARSTGKVISDTAKIDEEAAEGRDVQPKPGQPQRAFNAVVPILVLVGGVLVGLFVTDEGDSIRDIIGSADSYKALMWASLAAVLVAGGLAMAQRILSLEETVEAWYAGLKAMLFAMIILVLAWALSDVTGVLHTADYLVSVLGDALNPGLLPTLVFLLAAATAFATGSSWGTMGILMPLVVRLAWAVLDASGDHSYAEHAHIIYSTVSVVLAGSVWGDHCSPISDTTILSSMASGCDHIDHVRTQIPYAMGVGLVALTLGTLPTGFGFPWWASLLISGAVLYFGLYYFGEKVDDDVEAEMATT